MTNKILFPTLFLSASFAYAAHITTDASLTLGTPATATSAGNSASAPFIWNKCGGAQPMWQLVPDPWAVNNNASGNIKMEYTGQGSIVTTVNMSNLIRQGVNAFPFVFYGSDPFGYHIGGQPINFPVQVSSMSALNVDVDYSLSITKAPGDLDVAFDEWLIPDPSYKGGVAGALEVLVAPYFKFAWAPAGHFVGTFTAQVILNGKATQMVFNEYSTGNGPGHEIIFFPRDSQISAGDVRFNLLDFINAGADTAGVSSSWYLAGIEFGSEFGNTTATEYTLTTTKIELEQIFVIPLQ